MTQAINEYKIKNNLIPFNHLLNMPGMQKKLKKYLTSLFF